MNYQDPRDEPRDNRFWAEDHRTPGWAKFVAAVIVAVGVGAAIAIFASRSSEGSVQVARTETVRKVVHQKQHRVVEPVETSTPSPRHAHATQQARKKEGGNGVSSSGSVGGGAFLDADAATSFESMAASMPASVGLAVVPFGSEEVEEFGSLLEGGHAWSSIKVPILATVLNELGESLGPEEESWATSAITASDNEAAAALFGTIEGRQGGLVGASAAVGETLHAAGSLGTEVATAPPPAGAVSTYGQTEWAVGEAALFFRALGRCEVLGPTGTDYVESLMENVISEQRWGLGEGGFPSDWRVGMKGGWGPEAEAGGGYLVRQSGVIQDGDGGVAVAMIAMDDSGSYPAGAADLTRIAQWLAEELEGLGPSFPSCTS